MQEIDRIREANEAIDRRARQRHAAALAQAELTPEAIEAEKQRQLASTSPPLDGGVDDDPFPTTEDDLLTDEELHEIIERQVEEEENHTPQTLQEAFSGALSEVVAPSPDEPEVFGAGRLVFQWIVAAGEDDNEDGYQLGLQIQVDEQPPAGFLVEITPDMLAAWKKGKGLQGNRIEHAQFASALCERSVSVGLQQTGGLLVHTLERLMLDPPTKTAVGDDEPAGEDE